MTTVGDGLYQFGGMPVGMGGPAGFGAFGNHYFVDYRKGSDSNRGTNPTSPGRSGPVKTYSKAISLCASNNNDVIWIDGDSTVVETAMVTLSKNRVHTIGVNGLPGHYGAGAKVSVGSTVAATDIGTFKNTGVRNSFSGVKFMNSNDVAEGVYCLVDAGEYARYFNCEFYKSTDLDQAAAAEVIGNGDSSMYYNCLFGSMNGARTAAGGRPNILFDREIVSGKVARDNYFQNCLFHVNCGNTGNHFIDTTTTNDAERMMHFKGCTFAANPLSAQTMTDAIDNNTTDAVFLIDRCTVYGATNVCADADTTTYIIGDSPTGTTACISVEASAA